MIYNSFSKDNGILSIFPSGLMESYPHFKNTLMASEEKIGDKIKAKRKELDNLSVPKLALALRIPKDRIYKWERGSQPGDFEDMKKVDHFIKHGLENVPRETQSNKNDDDSEKHTVAQLLILLKNEQEALKKEQENLERAQVTIQTLAEIIRPPSYNDHAKNG